MPSLPVPPESRYGERSQVAVSVLSNLTPGRGERAEWLRLENAVCCRRAELDGPVPFRYQQPCAASPLGSTLGHPSLTPGASLLMPLGLARWLGSPGGCL